jgi:hypothetical protein
MSDQTKERCNHEVGRTITCRLGTYGCSIHDAIGEQKCPTCGSRTRKRRKLVYPGNPNTIHKQCVDPWHGVGHDVSPVIAQLCVMCGKPVDKKEFTFCSDCWEKKPADVCKWCGLKVYKHHGFEMFCKSAREGHTFEPVEPTQGAETPVEPTEKCDTCGCELVRIASNAQVRRDGSRADIWKCFACMASFDKSVAPSVPAKVAPVAPAVAKEQDCDCPCETCDPSTGKHCAEGPCDVMPAVGAQPAKFEGDDWAFAAARAIVAEITESLTFTIDYTSDDWRNKIAAIIAEYAASLSTQLKAELAEIAKALMIVFDGECWEVGFDGKADGFDTLAEACKALYEDADAVQKERDTLKAELERVTGERDELRRQRDLEWDSRKHAQQRAEAAERSLETQGWVISDGQDKQYRTFENSYCEWSTLDKAIRFARREDAEAFAAEDEDAWHIRTFVDASALSGEGK